MDQGLNELDHEPPRDLFSLNHYMKLLYDVIVKSLL